MTGARTVVIKAPAQDKQGRITTVEVTGRVAWLMVGDVKHKFLLQVTGAGALWLTDYVSGYKIADISDLQLRHFVAYGSYATPLATRRAAQALLDDLVARLGADKVLEKLRAAPALN